MTRPDGSSTAALPTGRWLLAMLGLAVVYYAAARLGLLLAFEGSNASPVWPPSGIALAAISLLGARLLPGVALGALAANAMVFAANQVAGLPTLIAASLSIMVGNTLEAGVGAWALRHWVGARSPFDRLADVAKFIVIALAASAISAAVGTATLLVCGIAPVVAGTTIALTWWTGDVTGMLVVAPLLMAVLRPGALRWRGRAAIEVLLLLALVAALGAAVFIDPATAQGADRRLAWLFVPCIAWAAFRHGPPGVAGVSLLSAALAVWGTTRGQGPFAHGNLNDALIVLQTFVGLCAVTGLVLAADRRERQQLGLSDALRQDLVVPWAVLLSCLAVTVVGWHVVASDLERRAQERFDFLAADVKTRIADRMVAHEQVLRGAAGLFAASQSVERDEWKAYVDRLQIAQSYPGIQAVGFARLLTAPDHPESTAITYIEPLDARNQRALGYDMYSEPVRRAAMALARDSGMATVSGKVKLLQETEADVQAGVLMYLPIYRNGALTTTVAERRDALLGFVYSPFRMNNLMHGLLASQTDGVALRVYSGVSASTAALLYDSAAVGESPAQSVMPTFAMHSLLPLPGQHWRLQVDTLPGFDAKIDRQKAQIVLIAGVGISLLLFTLVRSLTLTRERAELLAKDMTAALRDSERAAQQALALRVQADVELAAKNAALLRSNAELAQFAYVASHDLQEPLRSVASYSQLLLRRYRAQLNDEAQEFLGFIGDGARRAQELIADLLSLARLDSAAGGLKPVPLQEVFDDSLHQLKLALAESGAQLTHDALPTVLGDRGQLLQLMQNLVNNAIKFRGVEPPRVHVGATLEPGGGWRISVSDNGIGIDARFHERIFTLFQRLHRAEYPGTGIGLAICKKVVERHGGQIGVESVPGHGATFFFTIAAAADEPAESARATQTKP